MLKRGARVEDRRLQEADALVKCLAFDAITAWRVFSLDRYARDEPETPAAEVLTEGERELIGIVVRAERLLPPGERDQSFQPDIRSWVMLLPDGGCRNDVRCQLTRCFGGLTCKCRAWCDSGRPPVPETPAPTVT